MNSSKKKIAIVIVNYNGAKYQNDALSSLYDSSFNDFEVIVVDSASTDNSIILLKDSFPKVICLEQNENVGVAKGNNIGIKYSIENGFEYTLLMNNDVEIDPLLLEKLVQKADINTVTVPKIFFFSPHDEIWYAGGDINWKSGEAPHRGFHEKDSPKYCKEEYVSYAPTTCMLIHNDIFRRVGMIDEKYFMYWDDTDWCVRLYDAYVKILYVPDAVMWHKVSSSTGAELSKVKLYYVHRNQLIYLKKHQNHFSKGAWVRAYNKKVFLLLYGLVKRKDTRIIIRACKDYYKGVVGRCDNL